jgi:hypothetical protein
VSAAEARAKVLAVYPDAEPKSNDFDYHWIGVTLSEGFEADLSGVMDMPYRTEEELSAYSAARDAIENDAIDKAWIDAANRLQKEDAA